MNTDQYLNLLQMQQGGQQMQPGGQQMQQAAPPTLSQFSPIGSGASQAIESVRNSMGYAPTNGPPQGMLGGLMSGLNNLAVGMVRGDPHPQIQSMGKNMRTHQEVQDMQNEENMKIMGFLQQAAENRKQQEHQQAQLEEQRRYHDLQSKHWTNMEGKESAMEAKYNREMRKELQKEQRHEELQKTDPGAQYTSDMPQADRTLAVKRQDKALEAMPYVKKSIHKIETLEKLIRDNPGIISSNWSRVKTDKDGKLTIKGALFSKDKDTAALARFANEINNLKLDAAKGLGARNTVFLDKLIAGGMPGVGMPDKEMLEVFGDMKAASKGQLSSMKNIRSDKTRKIVNEYNFEHGGESAGVQIPEGPFGIQDPETGEIIPFKGTENRKFIEEALEAGGKIVK